MATFILIPGAGGAAYYWHLVVPELRELGHQAIAVDLPGADESAGLPEYVDLVVEAAAGQQGLVVVGQSIGGFTAPLACARLDAKLLVLVNPMIPKPGETAGSWWANTGQAAAAAKKASQDGRSADFDLREDFFHDVPADVTERVFAGGEQPEADVVFGQPWPLDAWPDVPTRVLQGVDDRLFPLEFQRRNAKERLGLDVDEMPGGHLLAFSQPKELASRLDAYWQATH
ncbi:alpha/beta fold hydrolase [Fodinicola feengrottensis]|uniref:Alpha/beta fold hydrolase n=1 Tax=Fodinicola feengrottensis TaxID=435914 RepID=A0ABP4SNF5_9ACTN|nr:alpha/beta fold hydrolase [Fodinicola feengrottensis]